MSKGGKTFIWDSACEKAFEEIKSILISPSLLVYFDPSKDVSLAVDASPYGVGAVLSHSTQDGEKPIAYASRKLSKAEQNYSQLEREALAIVYGVRYFHQYLCGRRFTLFTDHKPLKYLLGTNKGIPVLAASRLQRWAILLSGYDYDIQFRTSKQNANVDCLSRLPSGRDTRDMRNRETDDFTVLFTKEATELNKSQINSLPISAKEIGKATNNDKILSKVKHFVLYGWPDRNNLGPELIPYFNKRDELSVESNCLLWGVRVIIPRRYQQFVLDELHTSHSGIVRMKSLARMHVFWPGIDQQIEQLVATCESCQSVQAAPPKAPLHSWKWPTRPWQRIHIDFAGPFVGNMFLIVVEAHSKWPEVCLMKSTTSSKTITKLRHMFARFGIPKELVSDNGPQFVSEEFQYFLKQNGIRHIKSAVNHPASNGEAERFVRTFKQAMKKVKLESADIQVKLDRFLLSYRTTPHSVTHETPANLLMKRELHTRLNWY